MQNTRVVYIYISQVSVNVFFLLSSSELVRCSVVQVEIYSKIWTNDEKNSFFYFFGVKLQIVVG